MNEQELDTLLRTITPHERNYLQGPDYIPFQFNNQQIVNGKRVSHLLLSECRKKTGNHIHPHMIVKKHSRFQNWPPHNHDWVEINYVYSGECTQMINDQIIHLKKGQILLLDSDVIHTLNRLNEDDIVINIIIDRQFLSTNFFNRFLSESIILNFLLNSITYGVEQNHYIKFHAQSNQRLQLLLNQFFYEWFAPSIVFHDMINGLFSTILIELANVYHNSNPFEKVEHEHAQILSILNYIEENYKSCTLTEAAKKFNFNPNYLSNLLKKQTGFSYQELVKLHRLKMAANLLKNTAMSVTDVSRHVGYENVNFFYKKFHEYYNCLPGEYRINQHK